MLGRTAACLEPGSLRRLVPGSTKSFKSQRMLHSTFWIHGAGELDLPPLWAILAGEYDAPGDADNKELKSSSTGASTSGFLLDFLYPSGAFTLLRQFSGWPLTWQGSNHRNTQSNRVGYRPFSSGSAAITRQTGLQPLASDEGNIHVTEDSSVSDEKSTRTNKRYLLENEMQGPSPATLRLIRQMESHGDEPRLDFEDAWRQYKLLPTEQARFVIPKLLKYLSKSKDIMYAERVATLFNLIPEDQRDASMWEKATKAFIAQDKLVEAAAVQRTALKYKKSNCSAILIGAQLKASQWQAAYDAYAAHLDMFPISQNSDTLFETRNMGQESYWFKRSITDPLILELTARTPNFTTYVLNLFKYGTFTPGVREFAITLGYHALIPSKGTLIGEHFIKLLTFIQKCNADSPAMYWHLIWTLRSRKQIGLTIYTYHEVRQRRRQSEFPRRILGFMTEIFCDLHDVEGIQEVLDDWFHCYGGPDKFTYRQCLREFAWQADAGTVEALFEQYTGKFFSEVPFESSVEFTPLLNVYAKRGELHKVISLFEDISSKHKLEPNLACWNILLNAYGKVHDIDGAFERFEQLLDSRLKPDHWTFGTMMGICVQRGDRERTLELFQLASQMDIPISTTMIDCLVLAYIRDDKLKEAVDVCEKALGMQLICDPRNKHPRTRMWNYLIMGFAYRGDILRIKILLKRMQTVGIEYDQYTYSALMQSLAMLNLANRTWRLLTKVMPRCGIPANSFHYALVMGACLSTGELELLFKTYDLMLSRNIKPNASTSLLHLQANAELDRRRLHLSSEESEEPTAEVRMQLAEECFDQVMSDSDARHINPSIPQKGLGDHPVDIAYSTSIFRYMIHIYGSNRMMGRIEKLYADYIDSLPESRQKQSPPVRLLEALIDANLQSENYEGVEQCWDLAFDGAKKAASRIGAMAESGASEALAYHKFSLAKCLSSYLTAMNRMQNYDRLQQVIDQVQEAGFALDCSNYNQYTQSLVRAGRVKQAFLLCETRLMDNWFGWKELRAQHPRMRGKLPVELRLFRRKRGHLRPYHFTLLCLARGWLDANEAAAEDPNGRAIVDDLERRCPRVVSAVRMMPKTDDPLEIQVMTGEGW